MEAKDEKKSFAVTEEIIDMKQHKIRTLDEDEVQKWSRRGMLDKAVEATIGKSFSLRKQIGSLDMDIVVLEGEVREINTNQDHFRENITALEHHSTQAAKYIAFLEEEEVKLKAAQESIKRDRAKRQQLEKELSTLIDSIQFTKDLPKASYLN